MELLTFPYIIPCILASVLLLLFSIWYLQKKATHSKSNLPPGPWTLPIIGCLHHLATASNVPHRALHDLAQLYGPVMLLRAGELDLVVITSREAAKEVMRTQDANFAHRPDMHATNVLMYNASDIVFSNGPQWRQMRRVCTIELFSSKRVKSFAPIRQEEISSMLKSIVGSVAKKSPVNVTAMASELTTNITIAAAFGRKCTGKAMFLDTLGGMLELLSGFTLSDFFPSLRWLAVNTERELARVQSKIDMVLEDILQEHLNQPRKRDDEDLQCDSVDVLINVMESGDLETPITKDVIKAVILDLFAGGTETSATTITWAMTELMKKPDAMAKLQAEIRQVQSEEGAMSNHDKLRYLRLVIKETLRMHPPVPLITPRLCKETSEVLGYTIPSETKVLINAWSLGRNPDYWIDPDDFKPERFETSDVDFRGQHFEFVPFGAGRRMCPGIEFGMAVVEEALVSLLLHFDWNLPDGMKPEDVDVTETSGIAASRKEPLCLIPTLRVPLPDV